MHEARLRLDHRVEARARVLDAIGADLGVDEPRICSAQPGSVYPKACIVPGLKGRDDHVRPGCQALGNGLPLGLRQIHREGLFAPVGGSEVSAYATPGLFFWHRPAAGGIPPLGVLKLEDFGAELGAKHPRGGARQHVGQF